MAMFMLAMAVIWGACALVVMGAVFLSRLLPPVGSLLFEPPSRAVSPAHHPGR